ncbi:MAG: rRNA pseudouridine synthase [Peptostreptococcaceae bacterium]|jgi:23S rRNA pseudouridine2605 synthase|nr:rRNA pseudouridine synthase [Peptostreptococcaceae bacterium]
MRINKYIAKSGLCSRRKAEELIINNEVSVNDVLIKELAFKVDEKKDIVKVKGKIISIKEELVYYLLNKPIGYISSAKDERGRKTVIDLLKEVKERIYPIGRLDYDTSGLLLLTNDGDLTYKITHPKHNINKVYEAYVEGIPTKDEIYSFEKGLNIEDYKTSKAKIDIIDIKGKNSVVRITIHEGKNRQVRKMCDKINHPVIKLKRVSIGNIKLNNLKEGKYRPLTNQEIKYLYSL